MTTIYDVAKHADVSAATVSRVLNGHSSVDPVLVGRVLGAVRELGYRPNAVARNLRRSTSTLWAVIISDVGNPFFTSLVRGVEDVAQASGYSVVLCNSDEDPAKEATYIVAALTQQMAGVIISSDGSPTAATKALLDSDVPVVAIDRELPGAGVDTVLVDNETGAETATAHLIEAGYRRVACITGPASRSTARRRLDGYRRALALNDRLFDVGMVRHADFREGGGYDAMVSLLAADPVPDAVFVANNLMAVGAMRCLVERSVAIPREMGLVGFDDIPWADLVRPSITTVAQPTYELGRAAARQLVDRILEPGRRPSTVILPTELHVRDSSRSARLR